MYCLNKGKGSITIAPLVDNVLKLAEQYTCQGYPDAEITQSRERFSKRRSKSLISRSLQTYLQHARTDNARGIAVSLKTSVLSSEMDLVQNGPRKFRYFTHQSLGITLSASYQECLRTSAILAISFR
ncbi:MAG: hypothetical protein EZS28_056268, partial [Streblomastix strix]